jgi:hypothetical protein
MRVNLGDHLSVESMAGATTKGDLSRLSDDAFTLDNSADVERREFTRETVRRVAVVRGHARLGTPLGAVIHTSTDVYPGNQARLSLSPVISRDGGGLRATLRF